MRVGIDACDLASGITGVGSVIENLLGYLEVNDRENTYFIYQNEDSPYCREQNFIKRRTNLRTYGFEKEQVYFSARSLLDKLDIFHAPIHMPPRFKPERTRIVFNLHDLHAEMAGELYPPRLVAYNVPRRKRALESADAVIVSSHFVREKAVELFNIPVKKFHCFPLGVKKEFFTEIGAGEIQKLKDKYRLPERFILYVGSVEPWKRVSFLIDGYNRYKKDTDSNVHLVIIGRPGWNQEECDRVRNALDESDSIHWFGYVNQEDLPGIYQSATLFCSASKWEGFGIIFLEAFAKGLPVLAADHAAIPEVVGDAGCLFDVESVEDLAEKLKDLLADDTGREQFRQKGFERAKLFSWDSFGKNVHELYLSLN